MARHHEKELPVRWPPGDSGGPAAPSPRARGAAVTAGMLGRARAGTLGDIQPVTAAGKDSGWIMIVTNFATSSGLFIDDLLYIYGQSEKSNTRVLLKHLGLVVDKCGSRCPGGSHESSWILFSELCERGGGRKSPASSMHRRFLTSTVPLAAFAFLFFSVVSCQPDGVADPSEDSGKKPEIDPETQLNALRIYYAAKAASEESNPTEAFEKSISNVTFSNDESRRKSYELAFASACASGELPIDVFLSSGTDVNGKDFYVSDVHYLRVGCYSHIEVLFALFL